METLYLILLIFGAVVIIIGICRLIFSPTASLLDAFMHMFLLDWMFDVLGAVFHAIGEIFSGSDW